MPGFLDDRRVWDGVVAALPADGEYVAVDLAGSGDRAAETGPFTDDRFTTEVLSTVDAVNSPFLAVGHSIGSAVAELVAAARPELTRGLVLVNRCRRQGRTCPTRRSSRSACSGKPGPRRSARRGRTFRRT
ncbi:alpha/beta hydrolase [Amycolatopsis sp. NPDC023774]|uniref:alpha/beta fold hydrolase n=1 Tax=Amycolatopsis sp. NPDC023774 TaxID=3155015 RepID=UPI0033C9142D